MTIKNFLIAAGAFVAGVATGIIIGTQKGKRERTELSDLYEEVQANAIEAKKREVKLRKELKEASAVAMADYAPEENRDPIEITEEQFENEYAESSYDELVYYRGDNQLVDTGNEVVGNAEQLIGKPIADILATTDRNQIYVHNFEHDANFEITFSNDISPFGAVDLDDYLDDDDYTL